jgi:hypothetical protein
MKRFRVVIIIIIAMTMLAACSRAKKETSKADKEIEVINARISEFWKSLQITQDEIYKMAIVNEESEPDKARDYFNAHDNLRNMFFNSDAKSLILAVILEKEPTSFRPMPFEITTDQFDITIALGPTDEKTGVLCMKKKDKQWVIYDFDGIWQEFEKKKAQDDPNVMNLGD